MGKLIGKGSRVTRLLTAASSDEERRRYRGRAGVVVEAEDVIVRGRLAGVVVTRRTVLVAWNDGALRVEEVDGLIHRSPKL